MGAHRILIFQRFNASLFLSANYNDVVEAVDAGYPAGYILSAGNLLQTDPQQDEAELKVAFDLMGLLRTTRRSVYIVLTAVLRHLKQQKCVMRQFRSILVL